MLLFACPSCNIRRKVIFHRSGKCDRCKDRYNPFTTFKCKLCRGKYCASCFEIKNVDLLEMYFGEIEDIEDVFLILFIFLIACVFLFLIIYLIEPARFVIMLANGYFLACVIRLLRELAKKN